MLHSFTKTRFCRVVIQLQVQPDKVKIIAILDEVHIHEHLEDANKCPAIMDLTNLSLIFSKDCLLKQMEHKCNHHNDLNRIANTCSHH